MKGRKSDREGWGGEKERVERGKNRGNVGYIIGYGDGEGKKERDRLGDGKNRGVAG